MKKEEIVENKNFIFTSKVTTNALYQWLDESTLSVNAFIDILENYCDVVLPAYVGAYNSKDNSLKFKSSQSIIYIKLHTIEHTDDAIVTRISFSDEFNYGIFKLIIDNFNCSIVPIKRSFYRKNRHLTEYLAVHYTNASPLYNALLKLNHTYGLKIEISTPEVNHELQRIFSLHHDDILKMLFDLRDKIDTLSLYNNLMSLLSLNYFQKRSLVVKIAVIYLEKDYNCSINHISRSKKTSTFLSIKNGEIEKYSF